MVEQFTVPGDSTEIKLKKKKFQVVNSGLVTTVATGATSGVGAKKPPVIYEDDDDLSFSNRDKSKKKQNNLLHLMS